MRNNDEQIIRLLTRLIDGTEGKRVSWDQLTSTGSYQSRFNDYVVNLSESKSLVDSSVSMTVKNLNGSLILSVNSNPLALGGDSTYNQTVRSLLVQLYSKVDSRSDELEALINLI